jgi:hypothetical protein
MRTSFSGPRVPRCWQPTLLDPWAIADESPSLSGSRGTAMNNDAKAAHIARETILMLLSDDEVASVSNAESTARPLDCGEEYIDLGELDQGVRSALGTTPPMGRVLLRRSIHKDAWNKVRKQLAVLHSAKSPSGP